MRGVCIRILGDGLVLSASYEAVIAAEVPFAEVERIDDITDMGECAAPRRLLLIEEHVFWTAPDAILRELDRRSDWQVALAYSDAGIAARFYGRVQQRADFERFSFLPMNVQLDCWVAIFRILALGQGYLPADVVSRHMPELRPSKAVADPPLTTREQEILKLASKGKQNKSIAFDLGVSEHTVKLHMHHIIKKLRVQNRTEAVGEYLQGFPSLSGN